MKKIIDLIKKLLGAGTMAEKAVELRESHQGIQPGYHMNKTHWNSVYLNEDVSDQLLVELIDHSYELVYASLPKKVRNENPI